MWPMLLNTQWTVSYAFRAIEGHEMWDDPELYFDIAVSGGIVFG